MLNKSHLFSIIPSHTQTQRLNLCTCSHTHTPFSHTSNIPRLLPHSLVIPLRAHSFQAMRWEKQGCALSISYALSGFDGSKTMWRAGGARATAEQMDRDEKDRRAAGGERQQEREEKEEGLEKLGWWREGGVERWKGVLWGQGSELHQLDPPERITQHIMWDWMYREL